jgi:hypothetical protein
MKTTPSLHLEPARPATLLLDTAYNLKFANNYMITPRQKSGFKTASLYAINTISLKFENVIDDGAPTYGISFHRSGTNIRTVADPSTVLWQVALYQNPPSDGFLWTQEGQPITNAGWQATSAGLAFNHVVTTVMESSGLVSGTNFAANGAATKASGGQIRYGGTTKGAASCGNLPGAAGCILVNVGGTEHYIPFF